MSRVIIEFASGVEPCLALRCVEVVIAQGRISEARGRKQYCFFTTFEDGLVVYARPLRSDTSADSFLVSRERTK